MRELAVPIVRLTDLRMLIKQVHVTLNHVGRDKVLKMARTKMYHPHLANAVIKIVQECKLCQEYKGLTVTKFPLERRMAKYPYQVYAMDLMDVPKTMSGFVCVMVGIDCFSTYGHAVTLRNKTSKTVAKAVESYILSTVLCTPEVIFTDEVLNLKAVSSMKCWHDSVFDMIIPCLFSHIVMVGLNYSTKN